MCVPMLCVPTISGGVRKSLLVSRIMYFSERSYELVVSFALFPCTVHHNAMRYAAAAAAQKVVVV